MSTQPIRLDAVEDAVREMKAGRPILVVDDADRENEGDAIIAAQHATPEWVAWMVRHTSGFLCAPMLAERANALDLPFMVARNQDPRRTAYTVTVDAADGITTGISAADRARTLQLLADPASQPVNFIRPGHIVPLRAQPGGVLQRGGHTEAAVDLCTLAGLEPVGVLAELVTDQGDMMRLPQLRRFADDSGLLLISIADLIDYRRQVDPAEIAAVPHPAGPVRVEKVAQANLPTRYGQFTIHGYRDLRTGAEHIALVAERPADSELAPLVRVHSECLTGDALGSLRCDCGPQLEAAQRQIAAEGGVVIYLNGHEGRGIGLLAKLNAYALQDEGFDTVAANEQQGLPADAREYGAAASILADLGVESVRLLTNNPLKIEAMDAAGVRVRERVPLVVGAHAENQDYLTAKRDLMGHLL